MSDHIEAEANRALAQLGLPIEHYPGWMPAAKHPSGWCIESTWNHQSGIRYRPHLHEGGANVKGRSSRTPQEALKELNEILAAEAERVAKATT